MTNINVLYNFATRFNHLLDVFSVMGRLVSRLLWTRFICHPYSIAKNEAEEWTHTRYVISTVTEARNQKVFDSLDQIDRF